MRRTQLLEWDSQTETWKVIYDSHFAPWWERSYHHLVAKRFSWVDQIVIALVVVVLGYLLQLLR